MEIILGDARATGLPSGSFTGAASFHMLHHVPTDADQDAVFDELLRLVQPGGWALLADGFDSDEVRQSTKMTSTTRSIPPPYRPASVRRGT